MIEPPPPPPPKTSCGRAMSVKTFKRVIRMLRITVLVLQKNLDLCCRTFWNRGWKNIFGIGFGKFSALQGWKREALIHSTMLWRPAVNRGRRFKLGTALNSDFAVCLMCINNRRIFLLDLSLQTINSEPCSWSVGYGHASDADDHVRRHEHSLHLASEEEPGERPGPDRCALRDGQRTVDHRHGDRLRSV